MSALDTNAAPQALPELSGQQHSSLTSTPGETRVSAYLPGVFLGRRNGVEWTPAMIAQLTTLWAEGHSTVKIGGKMRLSKDAIVGKAHRLNLPGRPSPIAKLKPTDDTIAKIRKLRAHGTPLNKIAVEVGHCMMSVQKLLGADYAPMRAAPKPAQLPAWTPLFYGRLSECTWQFGTKGHYHACAAETLPGKSWCGKHYRVVFRPLKAEAA